MAHQVKWIFVLLITFNSGLYAQNLVRNPGFEDKRACPEELTNNFQTSLIECYGWVNAHQGSCDYFNRCMVENNARLTDVPFVGKFPEPRSGNGLIGFVAYLESADNRMKSYREYPMTEFTEPLVKDREYYVEFYLKLSSSSFIQGPGIEVTFLSDLYLIDRTKKTNEIIKPSIREGVLSTVQICNDYANTKEWTRVDFTYRAKGNERFLFIGNTSEGYCGLPVKKRKDTTYQEGSPLLFYAYYFVDDFTVEDKMYAFCLDNFIPNKKFVLNNLLFETDKANIDPVSFADLEKLADYLQQKPDLKMDIIGHTDNVGDKTYNMRLSFERAREVKNYLVSRQVDASRIKPMGMGSAKPVASNATEAGKALNRRVEIQLR